MNRTYHNPLMRRLRDALLEQLSPQRRWEAATRAETLLHSLGEVSEIPANRLLSELAGMQGMQKGTEHQPLEGSGNARPGNARPGKIPRTDLQADLPVLIEDLSDSSNVPVEAVGQRVFTIDELSQMFNVSTKTITRWRSNGLIGRRFVFDGRKRLGFLQSSVDHFVSVHGDRVRRGAHFSQMTREQRDAILRTARDLAAQGTSSADLLRRIAEETDRSVETIRYTIKRYDRLHPDEAIFVDSLEEMSAPMKEKVYSQYRRGTSVNSLARQHNRAPEYIQQVIDQMRARRIRELPLEYMRSDEFEQSGAEAEILGPYPEEQRQPRRARRPSDLPSYLASLYEVPLLTKDQEVYLFRKFNYLKFKAVRLRDSLDARRPSRKKMDEIERLYEEAIATKNHLIRANLRLVVSIAKKYREHQHKFFDLISDGNVSLIRAVEKFDYTLGNKFSTYASWAIKKNYMRSFTDELRQLDRFRTSQDEALAGEPELRPDPFEQERDQARRVMQVGKILQHLNEREQQIIRQRFGLGEGIEPRTLKEVGADLGVSKERVRQLEARALRKLRLAAADEHVEVPAA